MRISRRHFTSGLGAGLIATGLSGQPLLADGSTTGGPKKKTTTTTTGGTTTKKKPAPCCIDANRIRKLKAEIRKAAVLHNKMNREYKALQTLGKGVIAETRAAQLKFSGIGVGNDRVLERNVDTASKIIAGANTATRNIDNAGTALSLAESYCNEANKSQNCRDRIAAVRKSLKEIKLAYEHMKKGISAIDKFGEDLEIRESFPSALVKALPKTKRLQADALFDGKKFGSVDRAVEDARLGGLAEFQKSMLEGC